MKDYSSVIVIEVNIEIQTELIELGVILEHIIMQGQECKQCPKARSCVSRVPAHMVRFIFMYEVSRPNTIDRYILSASLCQRAS